MENHKVIGARNKVIRGHMGSAMVLENVPVAFFNLKNITF
jgi:hypothetical protein